MIKLYIGGAGQGQDEIARAENPQSETYNDFHWTVREKLSEGIDIKQWAESFCEVHPDAVVVSDEIGSGIVPVDPDERAWREAAGRALCVVAQNAGQVTRALCGIGVRIK